VYLLARIDVVGLWHMCGWSGRGTRRDERRNGDS
jgi:hypothetical protein